MPVSFRLKATSDSVWSLRPAVPHTSFCTAKTGQEKENERERGIPSEGDLYSILSGRFSFALIG